MPTPRIRTAVAIWAIPLAALAAIVVLAVTR